jgi:3-isopropylmalate/(R)-2-methylmalate dehydratase large subunit
VYSKDIILHIIKDIGANGATYKAVEFYGDAILDLSVDSRFTITNMAVEMGAKAGVMEADEKVLKWVKERFRKQPRPVKADSDARYCLVKEYDISGLSPKVAMPHAVDNVADVE